MFQSSGVLVKSTTTLWEGTPAQWPGWNAISVNGRWSSYAEMYRCQSAVHTVIDKRGKAAARLPFKIYEKGADGRTDASDSPYGQLMGRPSKSLDKFSLWLWTVNTKDIHGEAVWMKVRDRPGGRPIELIPLHPTKLRDEIDANGKIVWKVRLRDEDVVVDRRDMVIFREYNPDCTHRGMSKLEPLRATLENEDGARRANSALWRNGGRPSAILEHPGTLTQGAMDRLAAQWADVHGGVDNWAKAAILEEGMKATVLPVNIDKLEYIDSRKLNREEVCMVFDMAPPVVHILDHATFSNITEQHRSMYRDTMGTVLGALESTLEFELRDGRFGRDGEPDFGDDFYGEFLLDEVLRGAFEARAAAYQAADYMTLAEKREKENLPFIEGTDFIFLNSATLPLGPNGLLVQPEAAVEPVEASEGAAATGGASPEEIALMLQKIYLAVGVVITAEEAREIINRAGAGLTGPAPQKSSPPPTPIEAAPQLALQAATVRSVMGRLSRVKSLEEIEPQALVAGIDDEAIPVLQELLASRFRGESVDQYKARLRGLVRDGEVAAEVAPAPQPHVVFNVNMPPGSTPVNITNNVPDQPAPVVNMNMPDAKPTSKRIEHDSDGRIVRVVEEIA